MKRVLTFGTFDIFHYGHLKILERAAKYADELIAFAKTNNLELIIPSSFVKDEHLPAIYQVAKAFVFPGLYEGFGIPVLEAMASKIPVITSLNTSMAEIVNNNICLVNPISSEDIKTALSDYLVRGIDKKSAALLNGVPAPNFSRALSQLNAKAEVVELIKELDWQRR